MTGVQTCALPISTAPAESHFPVPVVVAHGVLAFSTINLVLLTVLGVGGG